MTESKIFLWLARLLVAALLGLAAVGAHDLASGAQARPAGCTMARITVAPQGRAFVVYVDVRASCSQRTFRRTRIGGTYRLRPTNVVAFEDGSYRFLTVGVLVTGCAPGGTCR